MSGLQYYGFTFNEYEWIQSGIIELLASYKYSEESTKQLEEIKRKIRIIINNQKKSMRK